MTGSERSGEDGGARPAQEGIRGGRGADRPTEVSFIGLLNVLLEHRRALVFLPLATAVVLAVGSRVLPAEYTSSGTFTPQDRQQSQLSQFSGLASQFGMSLPVSLGGGQSPAFYAELIRSENLLSEVVAHDYPAASSDGAGDSTSADLVEYFDAPGDTRPERVASAVNILRDRMSAGSDTETGVVSLSVTTGRPELSRQVADRIIELVNRFNLQRRRTQAGAERRFLEGRVEKARVELEAAEDSLERFLESNRSYRNSPTLQFRHQDLQRQVDMEQQIYTSLVQSLQQARIEEVRSTPVITVVEPPRVPARPDRASLVLVALLGLVIGLIGAVIWALGRRYVQVTRRTEPEEYARFVELRRETAGEIRDLWKRIRRRG